MSLVALLERPSSVYTHNILSNVGPASAQITKCGYRVVLCLRRRRVSFKKNGLRQLAGEGLHFAAPSIHEKEELDQLLYTALSRSIFLIS